MPKDIESSLNITIPPELLSKMRKNLILEEEVYRTVEYCEETSNKLFDKENDLFVGHLQIGMVTFWVEYKMESNNVTVINAYSHRIEILEEDRNL